MNMSRKEIQRRYYLKHKAQINAKTMNWKAANRARVNTQQNSWRLRNRDRINALRRTKRNRDGYTETDRQEKRRYYARHCEQVKKKVRARYHAIPKGSTQYKELLAKHRVLRRRWRRAHPKETLAAVQRYIKKHPEQMRKRYHARYIRKMGWNTRGSHTVGQWLARVTFYGWRCVYCGTKLNKKTLTKDHRVALANGGTDFASNLVPACRSCNSRKGNRKH